MIVLSKLDRLVQQKVPCEFTRLVEPPLVAFLEVFVVRMFALVLLSALDLQVLSALIITHT